MSYYLDRLIRLIDSVDFKTYSRLVLASARDDLNVLRSLLGSDSTVYLPANSSATQPALEGGYWFSRLGDQSYDPISNMRLCVTSDVLETLAFIDANPHNLLLSYELMREVKKVNVSSRTITVLRVPSNPSDNDFINLLTYLALATKEGIADLMLLIHEDLISYLKLVGGEETFSACVVNILKISSDIEKYLSEHGRLGIITCFPKADLEVFGSLANIVMFSHHLMHDYTNSIDSALIAVAHNLKDLSSQINYLKNRLNVRELILISIPSKSDLLTVLTVEPCNNLILTLRKFIAKSYELVRERKLQISLEDLAKVTGQ